MKNRFQPETLWVVPLDDGSWNLTVARDEVGSLYFPTVEMAWETACNFSASNSHLLIIALLNQDGTVKQVWSHQLNIIKIDGKIFEPDSVNWSFKLL